MAIRSKDTAVKPYRPSFLDTTGDLRPSVERELVSISNALLNVQGQLDTIKAGGGSGYVLPTASAGTKGGIKIGTGLTMSGETLNATGGGSGSYILPIATAGILGGIKVGAGLSIDPASGVLSSASANLPIATTSVLGGIKVGSGLSVAADGTLSTQASDAYTKAESDAKYETKTDATASLALKADKATTYTKTETDAAIDSAGDVKAAGDNTFTGENNFEGLNTFGNIVAATAALVDLSDADFVKVPEPTLDSSAATKKYVDDHSGGGSGSSDVVDLSYIGETKWHNHNVPIPSHAVRQDGQLLKRSEYPDLWSKIESGDIDTIDDAAWISGITSRGSFTKGTIDTGDDANFRVPDLNGAYTGSIGGLFVRGSNAPADAGGLGTIRENASPNIYGGIDGNTDHGNPTGTVATNPFTTGNVAAATMSSTTGGAAAHALSFNASRSSAAYGRNSATEVRPNSISGIWILIAKKPSVDILVIDSFIGAVSWFNGKRDKVPDSHIPADGQILNRADEPELWAKIADGTFASTSDALWLDDGSDTTVTGSKAGNRGKYSWGDGDLTTGTTFRVPDINGGQTGTIGNAFLRGYGTGGDQDRIGSMALDGAPNITGQFSVTVDGKFHLPTGSFNNAFSPISTDTNVLVDTNPNSVAVLGSHTRGVILDASKSSGMYGRSNTEIRPRAAVGIWIIKAKSATLSAQLGSSITGIDVGTDDFKITATHTDIPGVVRSGTVELYGATPALDFHFGEDFSTIGSSAVDFDTRLINSQTGTLVLKRKDGGGGTFIAKDLHAIGDPITNTPGVIRWYGVEANETTNVRQFSMGINNAKPAEMIVNKTANMTDFNWNAVNVVGIKNLHTFGGNVYFDNTNADVIKRLTAASELNASSGSYQVQVATTGGANRGGFGFYLAIDGTGVRQGHQFLSQDGSTKATWTYQTNGHVASPGAWDVGSDERHKNDILIVENALDAVNSWRGVTYLRKDTTEREVGLVAQDIEPFCPEAIHISERTFEDGTTIEDFKSLNISGVAAAYHTEAIKELTKLVKELRAEIEELKASK